MAKETMIAEGKTKKIFQIGDTLNARVKSKDDVTKRDGEERILLPNKGKYSTETTVNCFRLLTARNIQNHFIEKIDATSFKARRLRMIPLELVARRRAVGSYLNRNPRAVEGSMLGRLVIEFFLKDDARHDPLVIYDFKSQAVELYDAKKPITEGAIDVRPMRRPQEEARLVDTLTNLTRRTFQAIEHAWAMQNVTLVDLKIECGYDLGTGKILVGDVISNDEWRLWPDGKKERELSKQVFRDAEEITPEKLRELEANYALVAYHTKRFPHIVPVSSPT